MLEIVTFALDSNVAYMPTSASSKGPLPENPDTPMPLNHSPIDIPALDATTLDPNIPKSSKEDRDKGEIEIDDGRDPDDFIVMDEKQAKRIVSMCQAAFDVELTVDVVVADANVSALAKRVLGAMSLVGLGAGGARDMP